MTDERPTAPVVKVEAVPAELKALPHWVAWQYTLRKGKWAKPPIDCRTDRFADVTQPGIGISFEDALSYSRKRRLDGIGFVFAPAAPYSGIDLDDCRDAATGTLTAEAEAIVKAVNSYTEVSPSGTGVKLFVRGKLPAQPRNRKGGIEMYSAGRYFTVTGHRLPDTPPTIEECQEALLKVYEDVFATPSAERPSRSRAPGEPDVPARSTTLGVDDVQLISRAMSAENGAHFAALWQGDTTGYLSSSEADLALCGMLTFWAGSNPERVERLFGLSALGQREKWQTRPDYREETIARALAGQEGFFRQGMQTRGARTTRTNRFYQGQTGNYYTGEGVGGPGEPSPEVVEQAVQQALDLAGTLKARPLWQASFVLARRLRCVWEGAPEVLEKAVNAFSEAAGYPAEECYLAFLDCWDKVRFREGDDVFAWAAQRAEAEPIQLDYCPTPKYGFVASMAWHLANYQYPEPFWLPRERLAEVLGTDTSTASRIVSRLVEKGVIVCVREDYSWLGGEARAKEYRFVATPVESPAGDARPAVLS